MNNANLVVHPHFKLLVHCTIELLVVVVAKGMIKNPFGSFQTFSSWVPLLRLLCERKHHVQESFFFSLIFFNFLILILKFN
jgi:hypothetical protein